MDVTTVDGATAPRRTRPALRARRRDLILRAAAEVLQAQGLRQTTMDDIAKRLNTSKVALYRYFPNKEELIAAVLEQVAQRFIRAEHLPWQGLKRAMRRALADAREDAPAFLLMNQTAAHDPSLSRYAVKVREIEYEAARRRLVLLDNPVCGDPALAEALARGLIDFMRESLSFWVQHGDPARDEAWLRWVAGSASAMAGWNPADRFETLRPVLTDEDEQP